MSGNSFADDLRERLQGRSPSDQRILLVALLNKHLPAGRRAVLVGGLAVEFYTAGGYTTGDVDLVGDKKAVFDLLIEGGFRRDGRAFYHAGLGLMAETPGESLRPSETPTQVEFEGLPFWIVSIEDAIVDRLLAAEYWRSATDWEQAILMYAAHRERLDVKKLRDKAKRNECEAKLDELTRVVDRPPADSKDAPSD